jgi:hypothetical protein
LAGSDAWYHHGNRQLWIWVSLLVGIVLVLRANVDPLQQCLQDYQCVNNRHTHAALDLLETTIQTVFYAVI